jgi:two-component system chemotaxis response regulator CheY
MLLVDDSRTMRNIMKRTIETLGPTEFSEAGDGIEALRVIAGSPAGFDLIVVDWNMPNMDGITLVRKIRETDKTTPLMMVTTESEKNRVMDAIQAGVSNYAVKPFTSETLLEKVKQTLSRAKPAA